jgi:hypothetical protein
MGQCSEPVECEITRFIADTQYAPPREEILYLCDSCMLDWFDAQEALDELPDPIDEG